MATLINPSETNCYLQTLQLQAIGCEEATRSEWLVLERPVGTQVSFQDDTDPNSGIDVSADGTYKFRLTCYFDEGSVVTNPVIDEPRIGCPAVVTAGEDAQIALTGCDDDTVDWTVGGVAVGSYGGTINGITVTTSPTATGTANVLVVCSSIDENGDEVNVTLSCAFEVVDTDFTVCETSEEFELNVEPCGIRCETAEITVVFDCGQTSNSAQIGLVFKDCPECPDPDEPSDIEVRSFLGTEDLLFTPFDVLEDCGCGEVILDVKPDAPALFWNDLCSCPDWSITGEAVAGSSVYNACSCNPGQKWVFEGSSTLVASGPAQLVDTLIIWGHNLSSGTVTTSLSTISGNVTTVGVINDGACIGGYTAPIVINFADVPESVTDFTVTIASDSGGLVCIDQIFIGSKVFFPDDAMPTTFVNPHDGTDYELEVKRSSCGPLSRNLKHVPVEMAVEIECCTMEWIKTVWRPYLRWAQKHGVWFQHSRNNCPTDVFNGWLPQAVPGSQYTDCDEYTVTLIAEGYITQPQPAELV